MMVGDEIGALPTPALVVDVSVLERNIDRMSDLVRKSTARLRPHGKAHKSPDIASMQMARGAIGLCCQTVAEAEAFAAAGIGDILLTNQVTDPAKADRLAKLALNSTIGVCVDAPSHVELLAAAAHHCGTRLDIYIEVEVGGGRCGVMSATDAVALAEGVSGMGQLRFAGLQAYNGSAQHIAEVPARLAALRQTVTKTEAFTAALAAAGLRCERITGGGTGSVAADVDLGCLNELQCGSYALMDAHYSSLSYSVGQPVFLPALFVLASVVSVRPPNHFVIDAGLKSMSFDSGPPLISGNADLEYRSASDEHGVLIARPGSQTPALGERIWLVPGHCDPTIALHKRLYGVKDGRVAAVWPVIGRGEW